MLIEITLVECHHNCVVMFVLFTDEYHQNIRESW